MRPALILLTTLLPFMMLLAIVDVTESILSAVGFRRTSDRMHEQKQALVTWYERLIYRWSK